MAFGAQDANCKIRKIDSHYNWDEAITSLAVIKSGWSKGVLSL